MANPSPIAGQHEFNSAVMALAVSRDDATLAVASADGQVRLIATDTFDRLQTVPVHRGATLSLVPGVGDDGFVAGGEDGRLVAVSGAGELAPLAEHKGQWLEQIAVAPNLGQIFYAVGKTVLRLRADGRGNYATIGQAWAVSSTPGSLSVHPQEKRLAVAHYGGVSVYPLNAKHAEPMVLKWAGSHLLSAWHPNGESLVTTMQEPALHGWRLTDKAEMRMSGYQARPEAVAFMDGGKYLASAGSPQVICWPFFGGGPWGKAPLMVGPETGAFVTRLAAHPSDPIVAVGYDHGVLALVPIHQGNALPLLPDTGDKLAAVQWTADGRTLFAGMESGRLYRFTVESVSAAFR